MHQARPTPSDLRLQAANFVELAKDESDPQVKRGMAGCAFALSQLAESIARKVDEKVP
jgi:hypothetical protein